MNTAIRDRMNLHRFFSPRKAVADLDRVAVDVPDVTPTTSPRRAPDAAPDPVPSASAPQAGRADSSARSAKDFARLASTITWELVRPLPLRVRAFLSAPMRYQSRLIQVAIAERAAETIEATDAVRAELERVVERLERRCDELEATLRQQRKFVELEVHRAVALTREDALASTKADEKP